MIGCLLVEFHRGGSLSTRLPRLVNYFLITILVRIVQNLIVTHWALPPKKLDYFGYSVCRFFLLVICVWIVVWLCPGFPSWCLLKTDSAKLFSYIFWLFSSLTSICKFYWLHQTKLFVCFAYYWGLLGVKLTVWSCLKQFYDSDSLLICWEDRELSDPTWLFPRIKQIHDQCWKKQTLAST